MNNNKYYATSALLTKSGNVSVTTAIHYGESVDAVKKIAIGTLSDFFANGYSLSSFEALMIPVEASPVNADVSAIRQQDQNDKAIRFFFDLEKDDRPELESDLNNLIAKHYPKTYD